MTRAELIAALEKAEGPSRRLDFEIALAAGWEHKNSEHWNGLWRRPGSDGWYADSETPPHFTASIDEALTLVPKDTRVSGLGQYRYTSGWSVLLRRADCEFVGAGANGAIALCIAALKARGGS